MGPLLFRHDCLLHACVGMKLAGKDIVDRSVKYFHFSSENSLNFFHYFAQEIALEQWTRRLLQGKYVNYYMCLQIVPKTVKSLRKTALNERRFDLQWPTNALSNGHF